MATDKVAAGSAQPVTRSSAPPVVAGDPPPPPPPPPAPTPPTDAQLMLDEVRRSNKSLDRLAAAIERIADSLQQGTQAATAPPAAPPIRAVAPFKAKT